MYVCVYVRHAQKIEKLFFSVRSTLFPFKLTINLLGPNTLGHGPFLYQLFKLLLAY